MILLGLVLPPLGFVLPPLVIYLVKKDQSSFVAFHALQSLYFQLFILAFATVFGIGAFVLGILTLGLGWILIGPLILAIPTLNAIYAIIAGIKAHNGEKFEYVLAGPLARGSVGV
jgi:hypothetical protein